MDIRIGAKSLIYGSRNTSKVTDRALKASFAMMMAKEKKSISQSPAAKMEKVDSINQGTATINGNDLAQRLENVHKKIDELDFTGKYRYEKYRSIYDVYEAEFGFLDFISYLDEDTFDIVYKDREEMLASVIPGYDSKDLWLHRSAMGYDKMSKEEIIAAIKERVGGNSYVHKYSELGELTRAGLITNVQAVEIFHTMNRKAEKEYCAKIGIDHITLYQHLEEYYGEPFEKALDTWSKNLLDWTANTDITWLEIVESVEKYSTKWEWDKKAFMKEFEEISELLIESDKA